ncbi:MAG TPA: RNA polymerase sigma factor [Acidimicrobiales bacterium]
MLKHQRGAIRQNMTTIGQAGGLSDVELVTMLLDGNQLAFMELVGRHHAAMIRLARSYVCSEQIAEDVVQETWLAALRALPGFEGRSSVKTWLYRILINRARSVREREHKHLPISNLERAVQSNRFNTNGSWSSAPAPWVDEVEDRVRAERLAKSIRTAIDDLPAAQRDVLTLRDVQGMTAAEACRILDLCDSHQRVLLHRARSRLRNALEAQFWQSDT